MFSHRAIRTILRLCRHPVALSLIMAVLLPGARPGGGRAGEGGAGAAAGTVDARIDTDRDLVLHVTHGYLLDALAAIPGERVRLSICAPASL
jgi:hypothetical protein